MRKEKLEGLLRELPGRAIGPARPSLSEEIKNRIPHRLIPHRMDTINIMVDLRISRLAAAAVIVVAMILMVFILGGTDSAGVGLYREGKLLLDYCLSGEDAYRGEMLAGLSKFYEDLVAQGKEVVYYGGKVDPGDKYRVLMHWKAADNRYGVIFSDLSAMTVNSTTLVRLQARMLKERAK